MRKLRDSVDNYSKITFEREKQFELITNIEKRLKQLNVKKDALEKSLNGELQREKSVLKKPKDQSSNSVSEDVLEIETISTIGNSDVQKTVSETMLQVIDEEQKARRKYSPYNIIFRPPQRDK